MKSVSIFMRFDVQARGTETRGTQADVALRSFRVPRPSASSFTYRNGAPRRPESANRVGAQRAFSHEPANAVGSKGFACIRYSVTAHQPCRPPRAVGWAFPVGKGGARLSGRGTRTETSTPLTSATTQAGTQMHACTAQARTQRFETGMTQNTYFTWSKQ